MRNIFFLLGTIGCVLYGISGLKFNKSAWNRLSVLYSFGHQGKQRNKRSSFKGERFYKYFKVLSRINLKFHNNIICYSKVHSRLRYEAERYLEPETKHLCGIAYFRQVRDSTIHRGFYQKAVVILSHLPFHNLFRHLIDLTAPEYFTKGKSFLIF